MSICAMCRKPIRAGTGNTHHLFFPRKRFKSTRRGKMTVPVHIVCHEAFNYFFEHNCRKAILCFGCKYTHVCCYADPVYSPAV